MTKPDPVPSATPGSVNPIWCALCELQGCKCGACFSDKAVCAKCAATITGQLWSLTVARLVGAVPKLSTFGLN